MINRLSENKNGNNDIIYFEREIFQIGESYF